MSAVLGREPGSPWSFRSRNDDRLATAQTEVLRLHGYEVVSIGSEAAKFMPAVAQRCDLLSIGHAAPEEGRKEMVAWQRCPRALFLTRRRIERRRFYIRGARAPLAHTAVLFLFIYI